jgi:hypothetical protein
MQHVKQPSLEDGCFPACIAMLLDMTYNEVLETVPAQDVEEFQRTGLNLAGLRAFDRFKQLAQERGRVTLEFPEGLEKPLVGYRYLFVLPTANPHRVHCVAIDETGVAFDPLDSDSREHWSKYDPCCVVQVVQVCPL